MLRIPGWRRLVLTAPVILILAGPACTSSAPPQHISVTARPGASAGDQAVHFEVTGRRP